MKTIFSFLVGVMVVIGAEYALWRKSLGSFNSVAAYWIEDAYKLKDKAAESAHGPKVLIMSGSNAIFGLDSDRLSSMLGKSVINMASHAGLPFDFIAEKSMRHVRPGDVVVAPLEFEYYRRDPATPSKFEIENMESWAASYATENFARSIPYFRSASMLRSLRDYLSPVPPPERGSMQTIIDVTSMNSKRGVSKWNGYSVESINALGDMLVDEQSSYDEVDRNYITMPARDDALRKISDLKSAVEAKGASLFLTWPVFWRNPKFDLATTETDLSINRLVSDMADYSLSMNCSPSDFSFEKPLFFNTRYHLGLEGAERRTVALAECIMGNSASAPDPLTFVAERRRRRWPTTQTPANSLSRPSLCRATK
ncbi:hypothetical protein ELI55_02375 [Rhizobium ruizarguesonis]|uniref:hypothetical protein n=1 Tax=Rhizobium ruizarguesonis TaxID=2081791 RepID=UPI0010312922|nr:hypothetical protein [Rhizobium ruizarguesonis]TAU03836.1 hypothetical protein ELI55_02375 [Rhizobium ruizarguesonis]